jgi:hypothetical protein
MNVLTVWFMSMAMCLSGHGNQKGPLARGRNEDETARPATHLRSPAGKKEGQAAATDELAARAVAITR